MGFLAGRCTGRPQAMVGGPSTGNQPFHSYDAVPRLFTQEELIEERSHAIRYPTHHRDSYHPLFRNLGHAAYRALFRDVQRQTERHPVYHPVCAAFYSQHHLAIRLGCLSKETQ